MKKLLIVGGLLLCAAPVMAQDHTDVVRAVKADLVARGVNILGPCGAFQITGRVAWILRNEGWGLLGGKSAAQNGCTVGGERYAIDFLVQKPSGQGVDMLVNAGNQNTPAWQLFPLSPNPDLSKWRAPFPLDPLPPPPPPPRKVKRDFDGDGSADLAVYRPSEGTAYIKGSITTVYTGGLSTDIPVPADYDGDGKTDPAIFRIGTGEWLMGLSSNGSTVRYAWGTALDVPVPGDYDGDGKADIAVFRPSTGRGTSCTSSTGCRRSYSGEAAADRPGAAGLRRRRQDGHRRLPAVERARGTSCHSTTGPSYGVSMGRRRGYARARRLRRRWQGPTSRCSGRRPGHGTSSLDDDAACVGLQWGNGRRSPGPRGLRWRRQDRHRGVPPSTGPGSSSTRATGRSRASSGASAADIPIAAR